MQNNCIFNLPVCGELNNPTNGEVVINDSSRIVGSRATYTCDDGFLLTGSIERDCQDSGMWSGADPVCILFERMYPWNA
jgi:CUB/sushi domain-containing protein